jgi:putative peptidoglycan lipid II flippase
VARALACLAPGLVAFSSVNILARAFFALGDTATPMRISVFCLAINVVFTAVFLLGFSLRAAGLGVANTLSSAINLGLLLYALRRKLSRLDLAELGPALATLLGAAILAGFAAWVGARFWNDWLGHATLSARLGEVLVPMSIATAVYGGVSLWGRVPAAGAIWRVMTGRFVRGE